VSNTGNSTTGNEQMACYDLRNENIQEEYLENHKRCCLQCHENAIKDFEKSVESVYPSKHRQPGQIKLL
jgi:hypothetical protein